jgi:hypothetical protein
VARVVRPFPPHARGSISNAYCISNSLIALSRASKSWETT